MKRNPITKPEEHPDYLLALSYIKLRELPVPEGGSRLTKPETAEAMGLTIGMLNQKLFKWTRSGLLAMVRRQLAMPLVEEYNLAQRRILEEFPQIIENQIATAKDPKAKVASLEAAKWLHEKFVQPAYEALSQESTQAEEYIESIAKAYEPFDPLSLPEVPESVLEEMGLSSEPNDPDLSS